MFEFRIINTSDGNQIIDRSLKTPYNSLTPHQMMEYIEIDSQLALMDRIERKVRVEAARQRRFVRNLFYKIACMCRLV